MKKIAFVILAAMPAAAHAATNSVPPGPARQAHQPTFYELYGSLIIAAIVVGVIFGFLWKKGYLVKIRDYVAETREELKKCTWPSLDELKGSTVVVMLTIAILGAFTIGVDWILSLVMRLITSA